MNNVSAILQVEAACVRFGGLDAVKDVSITIPEGKVTALIGPNGAGKSTLLSAISGFQPLTSGRVVLRDRDITYMRAHQGSALGMARTFQDLEVMERLTVAENVLLGFGSPKGEQLWRLFLTPRACYRERQELLGRTQEILERVGLLDRADTLAADLSYGEQKMLTLARLLATDADLLMLDEPGSGLPAAHLHQIGSVLGEIAADGRSVILVDHNMDLVLTYADHVVVLHHGQVIATGTPAEIKQNPQVMDVYFSRSRETEPETPEAEHAS